MAARELFAVFATVIAIMVGTASTQTMTQRPKLNPRPIIGILAQEPSRKMVKALNGSDYTMYIAASYVKFFESGGARVVPILINQNEKYYRNIVNSVNGLVFPGGSASITNSSGYGRAGRVLYDLVLEAAERGTQIPLMTICLGFEMLMLLEADNTRPLVPCKAQDRSDPLYMRPGWNESQLFKEAPGDVIHTLRTTNSTSNFHKYCVIEEVFYGLGLNDSYNILSTSYDDNDLEYISTVEHHSLPIYGFQWHPEKNLFEWGYDSIPHTRDAIRSSQYVVNLFVDKVRLNHQKFATEEEELNSLIYNYKPIYIKRLYRSSFEQCYFF
ncbi:gamma-glutamyl hydrolase-like [Macrobrachium nipponense]|uniref:gamma-glutamyl hydrolase-like n=1 Tax=Macrobrachium nipponense TaxID=159736 RepID=UPI0030C8BED4